MANETFKIFGDEFNDDAVLAKIDDITKFKTELEKIAEEYCERYVKLVVGKKVAEIKDLSELYVKEQLEKITTDLENVTKKLEIAERIIGEYNCNGTYLDQLRINNLLDNES